MMPTTANSYHIDLIAEDRDGNPLLLGEVKATSGISDEHIERLTFYLKALRDPIPFALLADLTTIKIFRWDGKSLSKPLAILSTPDVLRHYDPEFDQRRIFASYLQTLVEAWLRDLAYHWKSDQPPAAGSLAQIGLLPMLEGGSTRSEVELISGNIRRD